MRSRGYKSPELFNLGTLLTEYAIASKILGKQQADEGVILKTAIDSLFDAKAAKEFKKLIGRLRDD